MTNYCDAATVCALIGFTITNNTRPNSNDLAIFLNNADKLINGVMKQTSNITDDYGTLSPIAASLCAKYVNNVLSFSEPEDYAFIEVALTPEDITLIRMAYSVWAAKSWDIG